MPSTEAARIRELISTGQRPYSAAIKTAVREYATAARTRGASWNQLAADLGLSALTIQSWLADHSPAAPPTFVPVHITPEVPLAAPPLTLVTPQGFRVEGLDLDRAAALLLRLT